MSAANQITSRNRGHNVQTVINELNSYIRGWLNYYKLSSTYSEAKNLSEWVRRRVRLYYWTANAAIAAPAKCEAIPQIVPKGG